MDGDVTLKFTRLFVSFTVIRDYTVKMQNLLFPLLILLVVSFIGVKTYENYVSYSGKLYDASGNVVDSSGNILDSSGNVIGTATLPSGSSSGLITLSLTDLMTLFGKSASSPFRPIVQTDTTQTSPPATTVTNNAIDMYNQIKPTLLADIRNASTVTLGAPYTPAEPVGNGRGGSGCSDSSAQAQGSELQSAQADMINSNEYIRKDSIPCYGCSLP